MSSPDIKICPYCGEEIPAKATKCKYCREELPKDDVPMDNTSIKSALKKPDNAHISGDNIESIGFDNPLLKKFRADGTKITNLNFTGAPALENIEIYGVPFKEIHFENNPRMDTFVLTGSEAEVIDMSMCPLMYRIDFGEDPGTVPFLKKLILPKNTVFEVLKVPSSVAIEYK